MPETLPKVQPIEPETVLRVSLARFHFVVRNGFPNHPHALGGKIGSRIRPDSGPEEKPRRLFEEISEQQSLSTWPDGTRIGITVPIGWVPELVSTHYSCFNIRQELRPTLARKIHLLGGSGTGRRILSGSMGPHRDFGHVTSVALNN